MCNSVESVDDQVALFDEVLIKKVNENFETAATGEGMRMSMSPGSDSRTYAMNICRVKTDV